LLAQESIVLQFEIERAGSSVIKSEVSVVSGSERRFEIDNVGRFAFTPTVRGSNVEIPFEITSGNTALQPRIVIARSESGSISWTSDTSGDSFKLTVSWIR
jgi:hypothetical protein